MEGGKREGCGVVFCGIQETPHLFSSMCSSLSECSEARELSCKAWGRGKGEESVCGGGARRRSQCVGRNKWEGSVGQVRGRSQCVGWNKWEGSVCVCMCMCRACHAAYTYLDLVSIQHKLSETCQAFQPLHTTYLIPCSVMGHLMSHAVT